MALSNHYDICCIGHITSDKIITPHTEKYLPGGTSYYFSSAISQMQCRYMLITALAQQEMAYATALKDLGIEMQVLPSKYTVYFENIYGADQNNRTQNVKHKADPFLFEQIQHVQATYYHLGTLLADDFDTDTIIRLAGKGTLSLDAQGLLRTVNARHHVVAADWKDRKEVLPHISILKVNEHEMGILTGTDNIKEGAQMLGDWGVKEVLVTIGEYGSVIFTAGKFIPIPAYVPRDNKVIDATGCGDTYMAGYLLQKSRGKSIEEAAHFASAMASLNVATSGPFKGTEKEVLGKMATAAKIYPDRLLSYL